MRKQDAQSLACCQKANEQPPKMPACSFGSGLCAAFLWPVPSLRRSGRFHFARLCFSNHCDDYVFLSQGISNFNMHEIIWNLVEMQILTRWAWSGPRRCISKKLPDDTMTADCASESGWGSRNLHLRRGCIGGFGRRH